MHHGSQLLFGISRELELQAQSAVEDRLISFADLVATLYQGTIFALPFSNRRRTGDKYLRVAGLGECFDMLHLPRLKLELQCFPEE